MKEELPKMLENRVGFAASPHLGQHIYVSGNKEVSKRTYDQTDSYFFCFEQVSQRKDLVIRLDQQKSRSVERLDLGKKEWQIMPEMQVGRMFHLSICLGWYLYVFGGEYQTDEPPTP